MWKWLARKAKARKDREAQAAQRSATYKALQLRNRSAERHAQGG